MARRKSVYIFAPKRENRLRKALLFLLLLLLLALLAGLAMNIISRSAYKVDTRRVTVADLPADLEGFSILHLSDLHGETFGEGQAGLGRLVGQVSCSAVVMTGDMVGRSGDAVPLLDLLSVLPRGVPVLILPGDEDPPYLDDRAHGSLSPYASWAEQATAAGAVILDEPVLFTRGRNDKARLWLIPEGLYSQDIDAYERALSAEWLQLNGQGSLSADQSARRRVCEYEVARIRRVREKLADIRSTDIQVVVSHAPVTQDFMNTAFAWTERSDIFSLRQAALILSGHYCGGHWRLPGAGAVYVPDLGWFPRDSEVCGWSYVSGIPQHISGGLGTAGFYPWWERSRLFNTPDLTRVVLTSAYHP